MTAPTLVSATNSASLTATATSKAVSVTVQTGDVIVAVAGTQNGGTSLTGCSGGGLSWTQQGLNNFDTSQCDTSIWTATATSNATFDVTVTADNTTIGWGMTVTVWRGSSGIGAVGKADNGQADNSTPALSLAARGWDSAIVAVACDWQSRTGSQTWAPIGTPTATLDGGTIGDAAVSTYQAVHWVGITPGALITQTAPALQRWSMVAVEVLGADPGGATGRYRRRPIFPRRSGVNTAGLVASSGRRHVPAAGKPTEPWYAYRSRVILAVEEPASSGDATVVAPVAIVDAASPAPTVTAIRNATVTPPAATVTVAAPTPTVGVGATVIAPVATVSVTALAPTTVSGGASATAPAATVTAAAPAPSVTAGVTVTTPAAGVATAASAPSITAGATVTAVTAALTVTAPAPTVAGSATVLAVAATVMVSAPVPSVGAGATVTTVTAAVTVSAPAPTVSAASSGGVVAPAAAVAVESLAPTVTAVRVAVVEAPTATITAGALAPTVVAIRAAIVAATAALVDVDALAPEVIGSGPTTAGILSGSNHPAADLAGASATSRLDGSQHGSDLGGATTTGGSMSGTSTTTTTISGG